MNSSTLFLNQKRQNEGFSLWMGNNNCFTRRFTKTEGVPMRQSGKKGHARLPDGRQRVYIFFLIKLSTLSNPHFLNIFLAGFFSKTTRLMYWHFSFLNHLRSLSFSSVPIS